MFLKVSSLAKKTQEIKWLFKWYSRFGCFGVFIFHEL